MIAKEIFVEISIMLPCNQLVDNGSSSQKKINALHTRIDEFKIIQLTKQIRVHNLITILNKHKMCGFRWISFFV